MLGVAAGWWEQPWSWCRGRAAAPNWLLTGAHPSSLPPRPDFPPYAWCQIWESSWSLRAHPGGSGGSRGAAAPPAAEACFAAGSAAFNWAAWQHHSGTIKIKPSRRFVFTSFWRNGGFVARVICRSDAFQRWDILPCAVSSWNRAGEKGPFKNWMSSSEHYPDGLVWKLTKDTNFNALSV